MLMVRVYPVFDGDSNETLKLTGWIAVEQEGNVIQATIPFDDFDAAIEYATCDSPSAPIRGDGVGRGRKHYAL